MALPGLLSLAGLAMTLDGEGHPDAYRAVLSFLDELTRVSPQDAAAALADEPAPTGDQQVDALLAAAAEHLSFHLGLPTPLWCHAKERFLPTAWFPVDLPSIRVRALVTSPASFARRGIFIDRGDLDRV